MLPGMPPVVNPLNLYSETGADHVSPEAAHDLPRVYVPSLGANRVYVIDPGRREVLDSFPVGRSTATHRPVLGSQDAMGHE